MTTANFSLIDITEGYKIAIGAASDAMAEAREKITKDATPQEIADFKQSEKTWELMTQAAFEALGSVGDTLRKGLESR
jgi:hypothetical protein